MNEEVESRLDPDLAKVFVREIDTDWKYVEWLYQAFKQRMLIEIDIERVERETGESHEH